MTAPAVQTAGLAVLRDGHRLLDHVDLIVPDGAFFALLGPNGAGKSTLLRVLAGVIEPTRGDVQLFGRPMRSWRPRDRVRAIAHLPQSARPCWDFSVRELLRLGAGRGRGFGVVPAAQRHVDACPELVERLDLGPLLERLYPTLSGGEQARAMLGFVLAPSPRLVLVDEPTASLDVAHRGRVLQMLRDLAPEVTVIAALHDLDLAARYASHVGLLAGGRQVLCGATPHVMASPRLGEAFDTSLRRLRLGGRLRVLEDV